MAIDPTLESALGARRSDLLTKLGNSAKSSEQGRGRKVADELGSQTQKTRRDDGKQYPVDPKRGRKINTTA